MRCAIKVSLWWHVSLSRRCATGLCISFKTPLLSVLSWWKRGPKKYTKRAGIPALQGLDVEGQGREKSFESLLWFNVLFLTTLVIALVSLQEKMPVSISWGLLSVCGHIVQLVLADAVTRHCT